VELDRRQFVKLGSTAALSAAAGTRMLAASQPFTMAAVGDCMITRPLSVLDSPEWLDLQKILRSADVAFGNFEMTLAESDAPPAYHEGCAYVHLRADSPENSSIVGELKAAGFDLMGLANNHSLDFGTPGLLSTIRKFDAAGLAHAGTGSNLAEARSPGYYDSPKGRVALVACASTFPDWTQAADSNGEVAGRPGLNPVRLRTTYRVSPEQLDSLRAIARTIGGGGGAGQNAGSAELRFLGRTFTAGAPTGTDVVADPDDTAAICASVRRASRNSDLTLLGIHAHEGDRGADIPSKFLPPFAHACIDAGADAFIGHGPHVLRGVEIYKGRPIFYSLGNFIFHGESGKQIPSEIYRECKVSGTDPSDVFDKVLPGFSAPPFWQTVVPFATYVDRKMTELKLYLVTLNPKLSRSRRGSPSLARGDEAQQIIASIAKLSEPFRTEIRYENGVGIVRL